MKLYTSSQLSQVETVDPGMTIRTSVSIRPRSPPPPTPSYNERGRSSSGKWGDDGVYFVTTASSQIHLWDDVMLAQKRLKFPPSSSSQRDGRGGTGVGLSVSEALERVPELSECPSYVYSLGSIHSPYSADGTHGTYDVENDDAVDGGGDGVLRNLMETGALPLIEDLSEWAQTVEAPVGLDEVRHFLVRCTIRQCHVHALPHTDDDDDNGTWGERDRQALLEDGGFLPIYFPIFLAVFQPEESDEGEHELALVPARMTGWHDALGGPFIRLTLGPVHVHAASSSTVDTNRNAQVEVGLVPNWFWWPRYINQGNEVHSEQWLLDSFVECFEPCLRAADHMPRLLYSSHPPHTHDHHPNKTLSKPTRVKMRIERFCRDVFMGGDEGGGGEDARPVVMLVESVRSECVLVKTRVLRVFDDVEWS